ncbi:MAG: hypothetical protein HOJ35_12085 [Bdellovibrionales bacterium]|jgi:DNA gyrase subunit A|nr:hypothetical protein [Bdellovibrionales bacterium]
MVEKHLHMLESVPLDKLVKDEYRIYQIYTLMDRAIPYLADGLKPGQRRILFTLWKNQSKGLMKVSSVTGLVLTLHPHGPASVESTIVNMAQDYTFTNNYPLIDKKGYFGERMETAAAASRYIECKLGEMAKLLLFDDMNQVQMIPNYDERTMEPVNLLPKLPLMLMNGSEGIGTGFSSVIPSFHHKDIIDSMIQYVKTSKAKKIRPFVHNYKNKIEVDERKRLLFHMNFEEINGKIYITELPRTYDATKLYKFLSKHIESGFLKDYIDSSVDNDIMVELIFKRGQNPSLSEVAKQMKTQTSMVPNYTLISENGVKIFQKVEEIIEIFTKRRIEIVKQRYILLCEDYKSRIKKNNEIIKFIRQKEYEAATKRKNRKDFVDYLIKKKFIYSDYLADMPIYRMTKDEVNKRKLLVKDEQIKLKEYTKVASSPRLIKKKLILELEEINQKINDWLLEKRKERTKLRKKVAKVKVPRSKKKK